MADHENIRSYVMLQELNNKPRTRYLARVTNPHPSLVEGDGHGHGSGHDEKHGDEKGHSEKNGKQEHSKKEHSEKQHAGDKDA